MEMAAPALHVSFGCCKDIMRQWGGESLSASTGAYEGVWVVEGEDNLDNLEGPGSNVGLLPASLWTNIHRWAGWEGHAVHLLT